MPYDDNETTLPNYRWWTCPRGTIAEEAFRVYTHLEEQDKPRQNANLHHLRLYGNHAAAGVNPWSYLRTTSDDRITMNVIAACCDVAAARIGKQRPAAKILPSGGNHSLRRKSKLLERFLQAQFDISDVYAQTRRAFLDGAVLGTGAVKIYEVDDGIRVERVFPSELITDPMEGLYGEPQQLFQRKWIPRDVLREMFAKDKRSDAFVRIAVDEGTDGQDPALGLGEANHLRDSVGDQVLVVEAWRLPSGKDAGDGKHVIFTDKGLLFEEEWKHPYLPFLFFRWKERLRGFWGVGIAEELCNIQVEINRLLMRLQEGHKRLGSPLVFLDARSKLQGNALTNEVGSFVHYMGNPPIVATFQTAHPEIYQQLDRLWTRAFDLVGLSQDAAAPEQASLSGISARTQHEIGTERFVLQAQRFEELHVDLSRQLIDRAKSLSERLGSYALPSPKDKHTISKIDWADVDMKEDEFILRVLPVSSLPQLPSQKLATVVEMMGAGLVDPETARELLDFPDLEGAMSLARAASDNIDRQIENILDEGVYEAPEPFQDIRLCLKKGQAAYNKAVNDGVPEENLQMLRDYMTEAHRLMQAAQAEQMKLAAAQAAQQGPVPAGPGAPPATGPDGAPPMAQTPADGLT